MNGNDAKNNFLKGRVGRGILTLNVVMALIYFALLALWFPVGNFWLFLALVIGEIYHVWQILTYAHTMWNLGRIKRKFDPTFFPAVDVFVTVCGEPMDVIEQTV